MEEGYNIISLSSRVWNSSIKQGWEPLKPIRQDANEKNRYKLCSSMYGFFSSTWTKKKPHEQNTKPSFIYTGCAKKKKFKSSKSKVGDRLPVN